MPEISVIIPNYNKGSFIIECLTSVYKQTHNNWEAIIIDDCSLDESIKLIENFIQNKPQFHLLKNDTNKGGSFCRNKGVKHSKGDKLIFLDSDDFLSPSCLEKRSAAHSKYNKDLTVFAMGTFYQEIGDSSNQWKPRAQQNHLNLFLSHSIPWSIMQTIWNKSFFHKMNGFDEDYPRLQDVELHTRALLDENITYEINDSNAVDCYYRIDKQRIPVNQDLFLLNKFEGIHTYLKKISLFTLTSSQKKYLRGTFFSFLNDLFYQKSQNNISSNLYNETYSKLTTRSLPLLNISYHHKIIIFVYRVLFLLYAYKIKGFNYFFRLLFIHS